MRKHWQHSPKTKPETKMSYLIVKALERWSIENKKWVQTLERDLCCLTEKKIVHVQQADKSTGKTIKTNRPQSGRSRSSLGHKSNSLLPDFVLQSCFLESKASGMTGLPPPPTSSPILNETASCLKLNDRNLLKPKFDLWRLSGALSAACSARSCWWISASRRAKCSR